MFGTRYKCKTCQKHNVCEHCFSNSTHSSRCDFLSIPEDKKNFMLGCVSDSEAIQESIQEFNDTSDKFSGSEEETPMEESQEPIPGPSGYNLRKRTHSKSNS